jgi:hypothetical protein
MPLIFVTYSCMTWLRGSKVLRQMMWKSQRSHLTSCKCKRLDKTTETGMLLTEMGIT